MQKEEFNYLTFFELKKDASIDEKLAKFSMTVFKIYFDIRNREKNNPNYIYQDKRTVLFLTELRNDIMMNAPSLISDYMALRYDYICIKCKIGDNNMIPCRYLFSYYENANDEEVRSKVVNDLLPYVLEEDKKDALKAFKSIDNNLFTRFSEVFIMLSQGEPFENIIKKLEIETDDTKYKNLAFYGFKTYYCGGGFIELLSRYARNGTEYVKKFFKKLYDDCGYEDLCSDEMNVLSNMDSNREKNIKNSLGLQNALLEPLDFNRIIIISEFDFYSKRTINDCNSAIVDFYREIGLCRNMKPSQYKEVISYSKEIGDISIRIKKENGVVDINVQIPDEISKYQERLLKFVLDELTKMVDRKKGHRIKRNKSAKKSNIDYGFLNSNINYDASFETLIDLSGEERRNMMYDSVSIANIEREIKVIKEALERYNEKIIKIA